MRLVNIRPGRLWSVLAGVSQISRGRSLSVTAGWALSVLRGLVVKWLSRIPGSPSSRSVSVRPPVGSSLVLSSLLVVGALLLWLLSFPSWLRV